MRKQKRIYDAEKVRFQVTVSEKSTTTFTFAVKKQVELDAAYDLCLIKTAGSNRDLQHGNSYVIVSTTYTVFRKKVGLSRPTFVVDHVFTTTGLIFSHFQ